MFKKFFGKYVNTIDLKGGWNGKFAFNPMDYPEMVSRKKVGFTIRITSCWFGRFKGFVEEDGESGGAYGVGRINGKVKGTKIAFVKRMPYSHFTNEYGFLEHTDEPHPPLIYEGSIDIKKLEISGTWLLTESSALVEGTIVSSPRLSGTLFMKKSK